MASETELTVKRFLTEQMRRLEVRWFVVQFALLSLGFWTLAILASSWLIALGIGWLRWPLFLVWLVLALPAIVTQLQLLVDILSYGITGRLHFYPLMLEMVNSGEYERRLAMLPPDVQRFIAAVSPITTAVAFTTPFIALTIWSAIVLVRTRGVEQIEIDRRIIRKHEMRRALELTRRFETATVAEFAEKHFHLARSS